VLAEISLNKRDDVCELRFLPMPKRGQHCSLPSPREILRSSSALLSVVIHVVHKSYSGTGSGTTFDAAPPLTLEKMCSNTITPM